jgi:hypothetical protein
LANLKALDPQPCHPAIPSQSQSSESGTELGPVSRSVFRQRLLLKLPMHDDIERSLVSPIPGDIIN